MSMSDWCLTAPCDQCPFVRDGQFTRAGCGLTGARVVEISQSAGTFTCHKTAEYDDEDEVVGGGCDERQCAGALIFAEKQDESTQMMRIAERTGGYDRSKLTRQDTVFDDIDEMLEAHATMTPHQIAVRLKLIGALDTPRIFTEAEMNRDFDEPWETHERNSQQVIENRKKRRTTR